MGYLGRLRDTIRHRYGLYCTHVRPETVLRGGERPPVVVEVFACGGEEPRLVYAWERADRGQGVAVIVTVLGASSVRSARDAVAVDEAQRTKGADVQGSVRPRS